MSKQKQASSAWPLTLFTIGVFMAGLDNGIISTALSTIGDYYQVSASWGAWSITLYTLGMAISVPIIGKLSDIFGRRKLFLVEIFLFGLGSLLVALSPNFTFLLIARFIQAIGGGGIFIIGSSYVLATLPKAKQGKALGLLGSMHGLSAVLGPNLGAVILHLTGSWQWMFFINIPIACFLLIFGWLKIGKTNTVKAKPLDIWGITLLTSGILALMYGMTNLDSTKFFQSLLTMNVFAYLFVGIVLLIGFILYERYLENKGGDPIVAFTLISNRLFQVTLLLGMLSGGFLAGIIFIPSYVQQVLHVPVESAGFWVTPLALASGIGSGLGGFFTDRIGSMRTIITAGFVGIIGFSLFSVFVSDFPTFLLASILSGIGLGMMLGAPLNVLAGKSARKEAKGSALGTLSLSRQIGMTLFPTIFAGFIAGAFAQVEPMVKHEFMEQDITIEAVDAENYLTLTEQVEQIISEDLRVQVMDYVTAVLQNGYNRMFVTSSVLAFIVAISGFYLLRKKTDKM